MKRSSDGIYSVVPDKMKFASDSLVRLIIQIKGDGDYEIAGKIMDN